MLTLATGLGRALIETVGAGERVGDGVLDGKLTGVGLGEGFGTVTFEPFFQMIFLPDFAHVYLYPPKVAVVPALEQTAPALTAACAGKAVDSPARQVIKTPARISHMGSDYARPESLNRTRGHALLQLFQSYRRHTVHLPKYL